MSLNAPGESFYNENDPHVAAWLANLVIAGKLERGRVDAHSIRDLRADDVPERAHFFAGIGGWPLALDLAGFPRDFPVWTGSCPCQPFSAAGRKKGFSDDRHLWPAWFSLIRDRRPPIIFGEQVASKDALPWFDVVSADLEDAGYAVGAADLCAAGVGAPHIRQRLYFVAVAGGERCAGLRLQLRERAARSAVLEAARGGEAGGLAEPDGRDSSAEWESTGREHRFFSGDGSARGLADGARRGRYEGSGLHGGSERAGNGLADDRELGEPRRLGDPRRARGGRDAGGLPPAQTGRGRQGEQARDLADQPLAAGGSFWDDADWIDCRDGKRRPVEPGAFPLAHGVPGRVVKLRAYGNAIVPPLAAEFVRAVMEVLCIA